MYIKHNLLLDQLLKIFLHWYKLNTFIFVTANETALTLFVQNDHISIPKSNSNLISIVPL